MTIYPAIDLKSGNCVRLIKGDFKKETIYSNNPIKIAKQFENSGATWLHIIDLDGAYDGNNKNIEVVQDIKKNTNLNIQFGGGIRNVERIKALLEIGVSRVILGTFAITNFNAIKKLVIEYPNKIIVSVDSYQGYVTYNGWQSKSQIKTVDFCRQLEEIGIDTIVYTDIEKDGMMLGPNFQDYKTIKETTNLSIIASGGVRDCEDIKQLKSIDVEGAIIGKALYINNVTLEEVLQCLQEE